MTWCVSLTLRAEVVGKPVFTFLGQFSPNFVVALLTTIHIAIKRIHRSFEGLLSLEYFLAGSTLRSSPDRMSHYLKSVGDGAQFLVLVVF